MLRKRTRHELENHARTIILLNKPSGITKLICEASALNFKGEKMNSKTTKQEFIPLKSNHLRFVLLLLAALLLSACGDRVLYVGTCNQQTQQFVDRIRPIVVDELNPVIEQGLASGPSAEINNKIVELDAKVSEINTPDCNPKTQAAKELLRQYMLEVRNYFSTVAGRALYGEGEVQGQLSAVFEANLAFETAMDELYLP